MPAWYWSKDRTEEQVNADERLRTWRAKIGQLGQADEKWDTRLAKKNSWNR